MNAITPLNEDTRPFAWFRTLGGRGRRAFFGAFGGYGLDSYDFQVLPLGLGAIIAYFGISKGEAGLGMGLYMARLIVESHHGHITFAEGKTGGARFQVALPNAST